jgi:hypothetical protein
MSSLYRKCDKCGEFHPDGKSLYASLPTREIDSRASKFALPDAYQKTYSFCENCRELLGKLMKEWLDE